MTSAPTVWIRLRGLTGAFYEDCKITTGTPAAIQSPGRRLGALVLAALIMHPETPALRSLSRESVTVVDECSCPAAQLSCRIRILLDRQAAEVDPIIVGIV
jgi:hypothetical protein